MKTRTRPSGPAAAHAVNKLVCEQLVLDGEHHFPRFASTSRRPETQTGVKREKEGKRRKRKRQSSRPHKMIYIYLSIHFRDAPIPFLTEQVENEYFGTHQYRVLNKALHIIE